MTVNVKLSKRQMSATTKRNQDTHQQRPPIYKNILLIQTHMIVMGEQRDNEPCEFAPM